MKIGWGKSAAVAVFFAALLCGGLKIAGDYGIGWDEQAQRKIGAVTVKYLAEIFAPSLIGSREDVLPPLHGFPDKYYGSAFEAPLAALEAVLKLKEERDIFLLRHVVTFIFCFLGIWAFYGLVMRRFRDRRIGLLAVLFMVLSPRLFADFFYNSKDAVFLAAFAIGLNRAVALILKPNLKTSCLFALAAAFAIDVRVMGIILPAVAAGFLVVRVWKGELPCYRTWAVLTLSLALMFLGVIAFWPYLWIDPVGNFVEALQVMSHFPWNFEVLYWGHVIKAADLPWHYIPVWIAVTTPLLYLALFVLGTILILRRFLLRPFKLWADKDELQDLVFGVVFFGALSAVIVFHVVLYDGWRQMYFIYAPFLLIVMRGWNSLWHMKWRQGFSRGALGVLTAASCLSLAGWMWTAHPMQNVYFNLLAGHDVRKTYEMDYWGLGNRMAMEYILRRDPSRKISIVAGSFMSLKHAVFMLPPKDRARVTLDDDRRYPYYVINNYRGVSDMSDARYAKDFDLFYQLKVGGEVVLSVFKLKNVPWR